jgi:hypothetical protein
MGHTFSWLAAQIIDENGGWWHAFADPSRRKNMDKSHRESMEQATDSVPL